MEVFSGSSAAVSSPFNLSNFETSQFNALRLSVAGMRAGTGARPTVMIMGDSTTLGHSAGTAGSDNLYNGGAALLRPSARVASILTAAGLPAIEQTHLGAISFGAGYTQQQAITAYDPTIVFTGTSWTFGNPGGVIGGSWWENNSTTDPVTITPTIAWNRCEISYVNAGNAQMNILVGGVAPTVGASSYTATGAASQGLITVGSTTAAVQALTLTKNSAGQQAYLNGPVRFWNTANPGIDVICNGAGNYTAGNGAAVGAYYNLDAVNLIQPDVVFANYGTNDWAGTTPTAYSNYGAALTTMATNIQAYGGQLVLVAPQPLLTTTDANTQNFLAAMRNVSIAKNCPMLSLYDRFDRDTTPSGDWYIGIHGNKEMYADIGAAYAEVLKLAVAG